MPIDWKVSRDAGAADRWLAGVMPAALAAAAPGEPSGLRVRDRLGARDADVAVLTRAPAAAGRFAGTGVVALAPHHQKAIEAAAPDAAGRVSVLPWPNPDALYDWDDGRRVADVTRHFHLEARPRVLVASDWERGQGLTRALPLARTVTGGELVLLGAAPFRNRIAPLLAHLGLVETVVLLPEVSDSEAAGLLHSADLLVQADAGGEYPFWLAWAGAAGLPSVAVDHEDTRWASQHAALMVDPDREDSWTKAVRAALENGRLREELIARGTAAQAPARLSTAARAWADQLAQWAPTHRRAGRLFGIGRR